MLAKVIVVTNENCFLDLEAVCIKKDFYRTIILEISVNLENNLGQES
jgi:hypothetical protein